jgi:hypothetical protein
MVLAAVLATPIQGFAQAVRCVDAKGRVYYGDQVPAGVTCVNQSEFGPAKAPPMSKQDEATAIKNCKEAVRQRLKAPGTARFVSAHYVSGEFAVVGEVDSQNSYGALVRGTYGCKMDGVVATEANVYTRR